MMNEDVLSAPRDTRRFIRSIKFHRSLTGAVDVTSYRRTKNMKRAKITTGKRPQIVRNEAPVVEKKPVKERKKKNA